MKTAAGLRIALRTEGDFINAYLAQPTTLEGAVLMGSIALGPCQRDRTLFDRFAALMKAMLAEMGAVVGAPVVSFEDQQPPEKEITRRPH